MRTNKISNQSFTSKIVILSPTEFIKLTMGLQKENAILDNTIRTGFKTQMQDVFTRNVRSCTGGFVIDRSSKTAPLAMHIEDTSESLDVLNKNADFIKGLYDGTNAFFIGGKTVVGYKEGNMKWRRPAKEIISEYAEKVYDKFVGFAHEKNIPVTYFKDLDKFHEAHIYYNGKKDTVFCSIPSMKYFMEYVKNPEELKAAVKEFKIAPTDTLEFWG